MEMNTEQVKCLLQYIDTTQPEQVKHDIFCQLGIECFHARHVYDWVMSFHGNIQAFLDRVNVEHASPYWEKLAFNNDHSILFLTGKIVQGCVCAFGECEKPPVSLCTHCCKTFQEHLFGTLFQRKIEVEITKSFIYGGERCNTAIHLL